MQDGSIRQKQTLGPGSADGLMTPVERFCQSFGVSRHNGLFSRSADQIFNGTIHQCVCRAQPWRLTGTMG